jgi:hypothetical protein
MMTVYHRVVVSTEKGKPAIMKVFIEENPSVKLKKEIKKNKGKVIDETND